MSSRCTTGILPLKRCCSIRILYFSRTHTNRILRLSRCYTRSPHFNFEKNVHNPFLGDSAGASILLLQFIINIHSKRVRCFTLWCFWCWTTPSSNWIFLSFIFSKTFALCFRGNFHFIIIVHLYWCSYQDL